MARFIAVLVLAVFTSQGCAALRARAELDRLQQHMRENTEAWTVARQRLSAMCVRGEPCASRLMKVTNTGRVDDWEAMLLPPYRLVVAVHEEELRRRHEPLTFEEFTLAASRVLAERADRGEISPEQLREGFTVAWLSMMQHMRDEAIYRLRAIDVARQADAETWANLSTAAIALGVLLTGVANIAAAGSGYAPQPAAPLAQPFVCQASALGRNTVTGQSYGMTVVCR